MCRVCRVYGAYTPGVWVSKDRRSLGVGVGLQSMWGLRFVRSKWYVGFISLGMSHEEREHAISL